MKPRARVIWIILFSVILVMGSLQGSEEAKIFLNGKFLDISFASSLCTHRGIKVFFHTHVWDSGEQFEFAMKDRHGPVYIRVEAIKSPPPKKLNSKEAFEKKLARKQEIYIHPIGKVVKTLKIRNQKILIISFGGVAGDQTEATVYSGGYSISFYLMQDGSYKRGGYGNEIEEIIKSLIITAKATKGVTKGVSPCG